MTRNICEILNKFVDKRKSFMTLEMQFANKEIKEQSFLEEINTLSYLILLRTWSNTSRDKNVKGLMDHLHLLNPYTVISCLNEIQISSKSLRNFLDWYLEEFVKFYAVAGNKEEFIRETINFFEIIQENLSKYINISKIYKNSEVNIVFTGTIKSSKEQISKNFDFFSKWALLMLRKKEKGCPYTQQYSLLDHFGLNKSMQEKLLYENVSRCAKKEPNERLETTSEKKPTQNIFNLSGKTNEEKEINQRKRELSVELKKYFDLETNTNVTLIEGEVLKKVLSILNELYQKEEVAKLKSIIFANNKLIKQQLLEQAKKELLDDKHQDIYRLMQMFLYEKTGYFKNYSSLINDAFLEINDLLNEYILLSLKEKENLKKDYQEQINLSFHSLSEYGLTASIENMEDFQFSESNARK